MVRFLLTTIVRDKRTSWLLTIHTLNVRISIWNTSVSGIVYTFTSRISCCCFFVVVVSLFFSSRGARKHAVVMVEWSFFSLCTDSPPPPPRHSLILYRIFRFLVVKNPYDLLIWSETTNPSLDSPKKSSLLRLFKKEKMIVSNPLSGR